MTLTSKQESTFLEMMRAAANAPEEAHSRILGYIEGISAMAQLMNKKEKVAS